MSSHTINYYFMPIGALSCPLCAILSEKPIVTTSLNYSPAGEVLKLLLKDMNWVC